MDPGSKVVRHVSSSSVFFLLGRIPPAKAALLAGTEPIVKPSGLAGGFDLELQ